MVYPGDDAVIPHPPDHAPHGIVEGTAQEMARQVIASHLCGWLTGHTAPDYKFLSDANLILADLSRHGIDVRQT